MTKMRVEFDKGVYTEYSSATEAAEDLRSKGYTVENITPGNKKKKGMTEKEMAELLPWETAGSRRSKEHYRQRIRERLSEYRRTEPEDTATP